MDALAIIPARGGSKRIPRKNIRDFLGRPIIAYSISAALDSGCFDEVMVSTDDPEIAEIARRCGASVPFPRSPATSGDLASTAQVLLEVLDCYRELGHDFQRACCIYPTAPFVTPGRLRDARDAMLRLDARGAFPVVRFGYPIQRALRVEGGFVRMMWPEHERTRSQDLPPAFHDCGQFYWFEVEHLRATGSLLGERVVPLEIPESEAQDIDHEEDWRLAELKYQLLSERLVDHPCSDGLKDQA